MADKTEETKWNSVKATRVFWAILGPVLITVIVVWGPQTLNALRNSDMIRIGKAEAEIIKLDKEKLDKDVYKSDMRRIDEKLGDLAKDSERIMTEQRSQRNKLDTILFEIRQKTD
jgi:hypothetical protein